jgi:hypothetical protein
MKSNNLRSQLKSSPIGQPNRKASGEQLRQAIGRNHRSVTRLIVQLCRLMKSDDLYKVAYYAVSICKEMI